LAKSTLHRSASTLICKSLLDTLSSTITTTTHRPSPFVINQDGG
jgi:uncharacterized membrane protein YqgA involved in biofilm formation